MSTRVARIVRGLLVAVVSLLIASLSHIAGGGRVGAVGFVLAFTFSTLLSIGLAGKSVSRIRVGVAVTASQAVFHLLFGVGAGAAAQTPSGGRMVMHGMAMPGMGDPVGAAHASAALSSVTFLPLDSWMWLAHALAALVTTVGLVKGERAFWAIAEWVAYSLARAFFSPRLIVGQRSPRVGADRRSARRRAPFLVGGMRHRGPPRIVASH